MLRTKKDDMTIKKDKIKDINVDANNVFLK